MKLRIAPASGWMICVRARALVRIAPLALVAWAGLAVGSGAARAQLRPFGRAFTDNLHGQLVVVGNSVTTCDRTRATAATCNAVETGEAGTVRTHTNDNTPTNWIDIDGASGDLDGNGSDDTFDSSRATAAIGGQVAWAGLYWWGSTKTTNSTRRVPVAGRNAVRVKAPNGAAYQAVTAGWVVDGSDPYLAFADVTALVKAGGAGAYTVANVTTYTGTEDHFGGWALVIVDNDAKLPLRHISLYDGYALYGNGLDVAATFSGFLTPLDGPLDAQLALITLDGDAGKADSATFKTTALSNALNPANDVANSTISNLGVAVATREPAFANTLGTDIDLFDVSNILANGDTSVTAHFDAGSNEQNFAVFAGFQTTLYEPDLLVNLQVADVNGGELRPGDVLEYTATVTNRAGALDSAVKVVFSDAIPANTTYVPGSLALLAAPQGAPAAGTLSDGPADDTGEFDANGNKITVRLGVGANATTGGSLAPGQTTVLRFQVEIDPALASETVISNQATVTYEGKTLSATTSSTVFTVKSQSGDVPGPTTTPPIRPLDSDGDGLSDVREGQIGTNPMDADSDDDGVLDGAEPNYDQDSDGDGKINALDPDSDNDGLFDGTELGLGCDSPATDKSRGFCRPDADMGATRTDPLKRDTDNGSKPDGAEDANLNGRIDAGETDPNNPADDVGIVDSDGDGLSDSEETAIGTNPMDADSDDDGVLDGAEPNYDQDSDGDGQIKALEPDSDNDGLFDGTEAGKGCSNPATNAAAGHCRPDGDSGATKTSVIDPDTDHGGVRDGAEDTNLNGVVDPGERNPLNPADDKAIVDSDGDGLSDSEETAIGSNPMDADTDDDGVLDGAEANPTEDTDHDGLINVLDPDSDNDGLFDGTEVGNGCANPATNVAAGHCRADADMGATKTSPVVADTDHGGVVDGTEDSNHNGVVDPGERNPNNPADDQIVVVMPDASVPADAAQAPDAGVADAREDGASSSSVEVGIGPSPDAMADGAPASDAAADLPPAATPDGGVGDAAMAPDAAVASDAAARDGAADAHAGTGVDTGTKLTDGRIAGGGCSCSLGDQTDAGRSGGGIAATLLVAGLLVGRRRRARRVRATAVAGEGTSVDGGAR